MNWQYGVTTVLSRKDELLPKTLKSLQAAGFAEPRLFIDGLKDASDYECFGLKVTARYPAIKIVGNWILALWELYIRNPHADRYAIFQDDFVTYKNLRQYLEKCKCQDDRYYNLNTFPKNEGMANGREGWYPSDQLGKSAVALMFSRKAVTALLQSNHIVLKPQLPDGWRKVDGCIIWSMKETKTREMVHIPSLVQHTGQKSTIGNNSPVSDSFKGENFDAMELLK